MASDNDREHLLQERIQAIYPSLTGALRRFADFVLTSPLDIASSSIKLAAEKAGVSIATANRFATAIGCTGYQAFRKELITGFDSASEPAVRFKKELSRRSSALEVFTTVMLHDRSNIDDTLNQSGANKIDQLVDRIIAARRIAILGFENAAHLGGILANELAVLREDVVNLAPAQGTFGSARVLSHMTSDDLVISIAFPRYIHDTVRLTRLAHSRKIPIIAITDSHRSPLAGFAVASLHVTCRHPFFSVSNTAALAAIEALASAVAHRMPRALQRIEEDAQVLAGWLEPPLNGGVI